jgi:hypothetical protein
VAREYREPRTVAGTTRVRLRPITALALAFGLGAALASAWYQGITPDEPVHLEWSRRLLEWRITERRSNEYFESKSPISTLNVVARQFARFELSERDRRALSFWSRLPTVGLLALLLGLVFVTTRAWVGTRAAHLATIACALDPNLIAHGSLATVDVPYAFLHLLGLAAAYACSRRPSIARAALLGAAIGLAGSAKFSAVLLLVGSALGIVARDERPSTTARGALRLMVWLTAAVTAGLLVVCGTYLFVQVGQPLSDIAWDSAPMRRLAGAFPHLRIPLPADFLTGFDLSLARERYREWRVVMFGRYYPQGVPYYFVVLWLMKTPLLLLAGQVAGYVLAARSGMLWRNPALRFLALNLVLLVTYFSFLFHAQIGYRFVLMCVPIGYVLAAAGLATLAPSRRVELAGALVLLVAFGENAAYLGNHLAFTNLAVQPKKNVFRWLSHSNVDWQQNEDKVDAYLASAGIGRARLDPPHILPGRNLLSHSHAAGNLRFERYRWVRENVDPVAHYGHTFILFDIREEQFERYLDAERRVPPGPRADRLCPADDSELPLAGEASLSLPETGATRAFIVCVSTSAGADLVLRGISGRALFGVVERLRAGRDSLEPGQAAWYRLLPGRHALALSTLEPFTGVWRISRGSATLRTGASPLGEGDLGTRR